MLYVGLLFAHCLCQTSIDIYVGNEQEGNGIGTFENPLPNDVTKIIKAIRQSNAKIVNIKFSDGMHFLNNFDIMGWDFDQSITAQVNFIGNGGDKTILHGGKLVSGWKKSKKYKKLWELD